MALIITGTVFVKVWSFGRSKLNLLKPLNLEKIARVQAANIYIKGQKDDENPRPKPWNWQKYGYNLFYSFFDKTTSRFDDNTKVIVVDGNIAAGKSDLAKAIAEELGMKYFPETTMDDYYINSYGQNLRDLDSQMPVSVQTFDIKNFYKNPNHLNVARFQFNMLQLRFLKYVDALKHLLNTGEGVVLDRSVFSDFVFLETSVKFGYISKPARNIYNDIKSMIFSSLMKPHLYIYLDVPTDILMNRIKKRNRKEEVDSIVMTPEYIQTISDIYRQQFLKQADVNSIVLVYDWSEFGDAEIVVEDIERIDFDHFDKYDKKLEDWRQPTEWDWANCRKKFTNFIELKSCFNVVPLDVPELMVPAEDGIVYHRVLNKSKGWRYAPGYDPDLDKGVYFK